MVTDRVTDRRMDQWNCRPMDGWTNGWTMFLSHTAVIDASENDDFPTDFAFFTKALPTDGLTDGWTDGPMDEPMDKHPLYRDATAASKKKASHIN